MAKFSLKIDPKDRKVGRFIGLVRAEIQKAFVEEGLSQTEIAEKLGLTSRSRSVVNRRVNGDMNLTLRTIGEMAWALGDREIVFELKRPSEGKRGRNHHTTTRQETGGSTTFGQREEKTDVEFY